MPTVGPGRTNLGFVAFDTFVQRFSNGDAAPMAADAFWAVFGPHVERPEPEVDFWRVRAADGGEADIHAGVAGPSLDSLMISRFSMGTVLELLVATARSNASTAPSPPNGPTPAPTRQKPSGKPHTRTGCITTITIDPTPGSEAQTPAQRVHNLTGKNI